MDLPLIEGELKRSLLMRALNSAPREACGIIHKSVAYSLANASSSPLDSFEFDRQHFKDLVEMLGIPLEDVAEEVILWHSHPAGGVGPSRFDMQNKTPLKHHLVVSLVEHDIVPTWY